MCQMAWFWLKAVTLRKYSKDCLPGLPRHIRKKCIEYLCKYKQTLPIHVPWLIIDKFNFLVDDGLHIAIETKLDELRTIEHMLENY